MTATVQDYQVFAARDEESNAGWVWVRDSRIQRRVPAKITHLEGCLATYCEIRTIDARFSKKYYEKRRSGTFRIAVSGEEPGRDFSIREISGDLSGRSNRLPLPEDRPVIVIGEWYRSHLGIRDTTWRTGRPVQLVIEPLAIPVWSELRLAAHHPDPMVRLATRLGVLGAWLGVLGITDPVLKAADPPVTSASEAYIILAVAVIAAAIGVIACRGAKRR